MGVMSRNKLRFWVNAVRITRCESPTNKVLPAIPTRPALVKPAALQDALTRRRCVAPMQRIWP
jgi:hypothetical protein